MALVQAKCTNCGANLEVDSSNEAAICQACGTPFIVEKAINNYNTTNNIKADVVNVYGGNSADFVITAGKLIKYNGTSTTVVIPTSVKEIGGAFKGYNNITSVTIPNSVTRIGEEAFRYCSGLSTIDIPNSVTSIGGCAFGDCISLSTIHIPDSVTSIGGGAFQNCTGLSTIDIPDSVTSIGYNAFSGCSGLKNIIIPDSVTNIGTGAFKNCTSLSNINISKSLSEIAMSVFNGCTGLNQVIIPKNIKKIDCDAFGECNLNTITIEGTDTEISYAAFADCFRSDSYHNSSIKQINATDEWKRKYWNYFDCLTEYMPEEERKRRNKLAREYKMRKNGCYVATCVYGSYNCPQVWTLRRYRDNTLVKTWHGRAFIHTYYAISPTIVKWFGNTTWFKKLWRGKLDKMVRKLNNDGVSDALYEDRSW